MAVGFKSGTWDLDDVFLRQSEFTDAAVLQRFKDGGSLNDAFLLNDQTTTYYRCAGCAWTCSSTCTGGCRSGCTGGCLTGCTSCTGGCTGTCTGCGDTCSVNCTVSCQTWCDGCDGH